jgi:hypothetical protein
LFSVTWNLSSEILYRRKLLPVTMAVRSKARNYFARTNTGIVDSNPTQGLDVCPRFSVFVLPYVGSGLTKELILSPSSPTKCLQDPQFQINSDGKQSRKLYLSE